jgi:hypothetical protein
LKWGGTEAVVGSEEVITPEKTALLLFLPFLPIKLHAIVTLRRPFVCFLQPLSCKGPFNIVTLLIMATLALLHNTTGDYNGQPG